MENGCYGSRRLTPKMHLGNGACQGGFSEIFGSLCRPPLCRPWDSVRAQTGLLEFPRAQKRPDYSPYPKGSGQAAVSLSRILEEGRGPT